MEESSRFVTGIDIGTKNVRAVLGEKGSDGMISVLGYSEVPSAGMRRGIVVSGEDVFAAVDSCLVNVEKMSGKQIDGATVSINGINLISTRIDGMLPIQPDQEIDDECIRRLEDVAIAGKVPENREVLEIHPFDYAIDGQWGMGMPRGMKGSRLEMRANAISALRPEYENMMNALSRQYKVGLVPAIVAASEAVLTRKQMENGVGVIDLGDSTTSVAIYDEGELQYLGVIPIGSNDITKDLAMILKTIPEVAEEVKLRFASANFEKNDKDFTIKHERTDYTFNRAEVDEVVEARLEEIFEKVCEHLKRAGYAKRLPEGVILTGGGANMRGIDAYAREKVELAARIGKPGANIKNEVRDVMKPEYATAVGLMLMDAYDTGEGKIEKSVKNRKSKNGGFLKNFGKWFK